MLEHHREVLNILSSIGVCVFMKDIPITAYVSERILYQEQLYLDDLESSSSMKKTT